MILFCCIKERMLQYVDVCITSVMHTQSLVNVIPECRRRDPGVGTQLSQRL